MCLCNVCVILCAYVCIPIHAGLCMPQYMCKGQGGLSPSTIGFETQIQTLMLQRQVILP